MKTASMPPTPVPAIRIAAPTAASTPSRAIGRGGEHLAVERQGDRDDQRRDERERDDGHRGLRVCGTAAATSGQPKPATATMLAATSCPLSAPAAPDRGDHEAPPAGAEHATGVHGEGAGREALGELAVVGRHHARRHRMPWRRRARRPPVRARRHPVHASARRRAARADAPRAGSRAPGRAAPPRTGRAGDASQQIASVSDRCESQEPHEPSRRVVRRRRGGPHAGTPARRSSRTAGRRTPRAPGPTARRRAPRRSANARPGPATNTAPGVCGRAIACSRLDLPAPFGPRNGDQLAGREQ